MRNWLKNKISICLLILCMGTIVSCSTFGNGKFDVPKLTVSSEEYKNNIVPLIDVLKIIYADKLNSDQQKLYGDILAALDEKAKVQSEIDILPTIAAVLVPVVIEHKFSNVKIEPEKVVVALAGLQFVESKFGDDSVVSPLTPIVEEILKNSMKD